MANGKPCGSCGMTIEFAFKHPDEMNPNTGRLVTNPIDWATVDAEDGNLAVWRDDRGIARYRNLTKKAPDLREGEHRAKSHFATCEHADQHRRRV